MANLAWCKELYIENCWDYEILFFSLRKNATVSLFFWCLVKYGGKKNVKAAIQNKPRCFLFKKQGWLEGSHNMWSKTAAMQKTPTKKTAAKKTYLHLNCAELKRITKHRNHGDGARSCPTHTTCNKTTCDNQIHFFCEKKLVKPSSW